MNINQIIKIWMSCIDCPFNENCPCGYSYGNAACLTIRKDYADSMTAKSDALYSKNQQTQAHQSY